MEKKKTALITGGSKGMGRAISFTLAEMGYDLLVCARSTADLKELKADIQQTFPGVQVHWMSVDFSQAEAAEEVCFAFKAYCVDVLVNNVGIFCPDSILEVDAPLFQQQMQVNLNTPRYLSAYWGNLMKARKSGHIINITSIASRQPHASAGSYTVTKFALKGLTKVLRETLRPYGVKVTEIVPGSTFTASWAGTDLPQTQFIQPEDIAAAVALSLKSSAGALVDEIVVTPVRDVTA